MKEIILMCQEIINSIEKSVKKLNYSMKQFEKNKEKIKRLKN